MSEKVNKSDLEWQEELSPEAYRITRQKGTERAFSGEYENLDEEGTFKCICCGAPLFTSNEKYHSGSGSLTWDDPLVRMPVMGFYGPEGGVKGRPGGERCLE